MKSVIGPKMKTASMAGFMAVAMVGVGFAAVPLYDLFCRVTGFAGTTQRADASAMVGEPVILNRTVSVRFDANVSPKLPWSFRPEHPRDTVSIGARDMAIYIAENNSSQPITGTASFNVTPVTAGKYFTKIQCFCFTEQRLEPGQQMRMPVLFYVDPKIMDDPDTRDIKEITLSYTFYPVDEGKKPS
ncbi:cytochrome c oxidase assembly protein [Sphingopyxis yananensis]|jgi:cytochrome c oxidase assembly protein subunit 11|uniref:cytochrome c oxidase assembly protein n=1 Tax=Sphingopyxis yananensis TaxID=2886687 RepID=UPI001D11049C|nr:cytochrome c oxidase assembly protein [Sphingopyxis yananensis]MCC2602200.1 cytochrome c oxidase assembly protein [Sphingopyxis yananensis]